MGLVSNIKKSVSNAYTSVDKIVGGVLPGGAPTKTQQQQQVQAQNNAMSQANVNYTPSPAPQSTPYTPAKSQNNTPYYTPPSNSNGNKGGGGSGGGGGSSYTPVSNVVTQTGPMSVASQSDVQQMTPVPQSNPQNVVTQAGPMSVQQQPIRNTNQYNPAVDIPHQNRGPTQFGLGLPGIPGQGAFGTLANLATQAKNTVEDRFTRDKTNLEQSKAKQVSNIAQGKREQAFTQSGRGTTMTTFAPYSNEEVIKLGDQGKVSKDIVLKVLENREIAKHGTERQVYINAITPELQRKGKEELTNTYNELQMKVQRGEISADAANKQLQTKQDQVNAQINSELTNKVANWEASRGRSLNTESKKYLQEVSSKAAVNDAIRLAPLLIAAGAVTGGVAAGIAASGTVGAAAVEVGGYVLGAQAAVSTGKAVGTSIGQGTLTPARLGEILIPQILFAGGGYAGAKATGTTITKIRQDKLNEAFNSADTSIKQIEIQKITKESKLAALKIPDFQKEELIGRFRAGEQIEFSRSKLTNPDKRLQKILDKAAPGLEIQTFRTTQLGTNNVITRNELIKTTFQRGYEQYTDYQTGQGLGYLDKKSGRFVMQSVNTRFAPNNKGQMSPVEILKQLEVGRGKVSPETKDTIVDFNSEQVRKGNTRVVEGESYVFEGTKLIGTEKKPLTAGDLREVARDAYFNSYPSVKIKNKEVQELIGEKKGRIDIGQTNDGTGRPKYSIAEIQKTYKTLTEDVQMTKLPAPEFEMKSVSKKVSGFEEIELPKDLPKVSIEQPKRKGGRPKGSKNKYPSQTMQVLEESPYSGTGNYEVNEQDLLGAIPSASQSKSVSRILEEVSPKPVKTGNFPALGGPKLKDIGSEEFEDFKPNVKMSTSSIQKTIDDQEDLLSPKTRTKTPQVPRMSSKDILAPAQRDNLGLKTPELQVPKLKIETQQFEVPELPPVPTIKIPKIKPPKIPEPQLPTSGQGGGGNASRRASIKSRKASRKYTASLLSAAVQVKPVKVSKKKLKQLDETMYSGIEERPVIELVNDKGVKF